MQGRILYTLEKLSCIIMYERIWLYTYIFIRSCFVVNFNVSNTNITHMLDTSSMGVTTLIR
jgi:hypothetical protein